MLQARLLGDLGRLGAEAQQATARDVAALIDGAAALFYHREGATAAD